MTAEDFKALCGEFATQERLMLFDCKDREYGSEKDKLHANRMMADLLGISLPEVFLALLCAALGKPRQEAPTDNERWPTLAALASLRFAVRIDHPGRVERDYHTAGGSHHKNERYGVVRADGASWTPVVSQRYYLSDASFLAGLEGDLARLEALAAALRAPVWPVYLGRKAFVPSLPAFLDDGLSERPLSEALRAYPWTARSEAEKGQALSGNLRLPIVADIGVFPEAGADSGDIRHDVPLSFEERRFGTRTVATVFVTVSPEQVREGG